MKKAFIFLHISVLLAGFTGVFGKLIQLNAGLISWYRLLLSALLMLILVLFSGGIPKIGWRTMLRIGLAGMLIGFHWIFFYASIQHANISVGVVCFALTSFFTALFEPVFSRRRISVPEILLSSLTLAGIGLIFGLDATYRTGILLGVVSSMLAALYGICNERLAKSYPSQTVMFYALAGGAAALTLIMPVYIPALKIQRMMPTLSDFGYLFILASACTVLLYLLVTVAQQKVSAFTVNITFNLEPLYSIVLAILFFNESRELSPVFYLGLSLIVASVVLQMFRISATPRQLRGAPENQG